MQAGPTVADIERYERRRPARRSARSRTDDRLWLEDYQRFEHTRLDRVQAAAQVWLGVLTTLVGLAGSVVLIKGNALLSGLTSSLVFQSVTICLIVLGFGSALLAIISGAAASWGGLSAIGHGGMPGYRKLAFRVILRFAFDAEQMPPPLAVQPASKAAQYRDQYQRAAISRRNLLQASRALGILTAAVIAALAVVILLEGAIAPAPADIMVIHGGRLTCGPVSATLQYSDVTRVVPVTGC
jgi:hypothetical protein